jgi:hypothetical protein
MEKNALDKIAGHSCGQSALKCIDCADQVCPKCMVQCAVGNRCKKCAGRFTSHVLLVTPKVLIKLLLVTGIFGYLYGYVEPQLPGMGFYGYLIQFGLAYALGRLAHRAASYKLGAKIILTALLGLAVGLVLGPTREIILSSIELSQQPDEEGVTSNILSTHLIHLAIFTVGLMMPLWKKN